MSDAIVTGRKRILITGCTSGIGLAIAEYLYKKKYEPVLVGRNKSKLECVSKELGGAPFFICDLQINEDISKIFDFCEENGYKLDGIVHAAGISVNYPIRNIKYQDLNEQMQINCFSFVELCKHFWSKSISNDGGSIVALSSYAVYTKKKGGAMYVASKNALDSVVSIASKEFLKRKIRVNAIAPAYVDTRMNIGLDDLMDVKSIQPLGLIPPEDIAYLAEFLISDKSKYMTGSIIPVSAGMDGQ